MRPEMVIDINALSARLGRIDADASRLRRALVRMARRCDHPVVAGIIR